METVYFDFETSSLRPDMENIQIAAVAINEKWEETGVFQSKIKFDESKADPEALALNHYSREFWEKKLCLNTQHNPNSTSFSTSTSVSTV